MLETSTIAVARACQTTVQSIREANLALRKVTSMVRCYIVAIPIDNYLCAELQCLLRRDGRGWIYAFLDSINASRVPMGIND